MSDWARPGRAAGVAVAGLALATAACWLFAVTGWQAWSAVRATELARPADALLALLALVGVLLSAWLGAGIVVSALARLPGAFGAAFGRAEARIAPAALRHVVGVLVGAAVVAGAGGGTAVAQEGPAAGTSNAMMRAAARAVSAPDPAFVPSSPAQNWAQQASLTPAPDPAFAPTTANPALGLGTVRRPVRTEASADHRAVIVVKRGDTLWDIAEAHLRPGSTPAEVAVAAIAGTSRTGTSSATTRTSSSSVSGSRPRHRVPHHH